MLCLGLAAYLSLGAAGLMLGMRTTIPGPAAESTLSTIPGEEAAAAAGLYKTDMLTLVLEHEQLKASEARFHSAAEELIQLLQQQRTLAGEQLFSSIETVGHTLAMDETAFVSHDGKSQMIAAKPRGPIHLSAERLSVLPAALAAWNRTFPEFKLHYLSSGTLSNEMFGLIDDDLDRSLIYTLPLTLMILLWVFGSVTAALVPLGIALVSLFAALGASAALSRLLGPVSAAASQLVVLLVIAIGVDYSLFMISRMREEVRRGATYPEAVKRARRRTGMAVLWSGATVALSLFGLFLMNDSVLSSMALVSIASVVLTVFASLTMLPALLLMLDRRIEAGRIRAPHAEQHRMLAYVLNLSVRRPWLVLFIGASLMLTLSSFALSLKLGTTVEPQMFPETLQSKRAFSALERNFPDAAGSDLSIVLIGKRLPDLEATGMVQAFIDQLAEAQTLRGPLQVEQSPDETVMRLSFLAVGSGNDPRNIELIDKLRDEQIPRLASEGLDVHLSGTLPYVVEEIERYSIRSALVFTAVLTLSFALLLVAFRSIIVPLKAVLLNVLSTAAAFGTLVMLFQWSSLPGWHFGVVESFVPSLLFSILFGLSMDYHVFILSRIRENVLQGLSTKDAVERGIIQTSGTVTSAALIMVCVFSVIACLELPIMRQLGVGLGTAVLLDATVVRSLLLPAGMVLLDRWNWYLPRILRSLPEITLE